MKLYTEEQVRKAIELAQECEHDGYYPINFDYNQTEILEHLTPIELPSDEELSEEGQKQWGNVHSVGVVGWLDGAKWMRGKIQGGN